jgi:predicted phosphodiesterase
LKADLKSTDKDHIFVFGHEPAFPQADEKTGITSHYLESLDEYPQARDRFWQLLHDESVDAYFCGHSHNYSAVRIDDVWQIESGQAMGTRAAPSPGTFLIVTVQGETVTIETYRGEDAPGFGYLLTETFQITP